MKNEIKRFLKSGKLELYVLKLLDEQETREVEEMIERHPELQFVYSEMKNALDNYADKQIDQHVEEEKKTVRVTTYTSRRMLPESESSNKMNLWVAATIASVILNVFLFFSYSQEHKAKEALGRQVQSMEQRFLAQQVQMQDEYRMLLDTYTHFVPLYQTPGDTQQKAVVVWNRQTGEGFVFSAWLTAPPAGYSYRLWAVDAQGKSYEVTDLQLHTICRTQVVADVSRWMLTLERKTGDERQVVAQAAMKG